MAEIPEVNGEPIASDAAEEPWTPSAADVPAWQDPVEADWADEPAQGEAPGGELMPPRDPFEPRPGGEWVTAGAPAAEEPEPEPEPEEEPGKEPWSKENEKARKRELKQEQKDYKAHKWATRPRRQASKIAAITLVVGLVIGALVGAIGLSMVRDNNTADAVFSVVQDQTEHVAVTETVYAEETMVKPAEFFGSDVSFIESECLVRYVGDVTFAVDMSGIELVGRDGDAFTVSLDPPFLASNTPDMEKSGIVYVDNNAVKTINLADSSQFVAACKAKVEAQARADEELLEQARANTQAELTEMFSARLGKPCTVEVYWR